MRKLVLDLLPPLLLQWLRHLKQQHYGWAGNYNTWNEAKLKSTGYDHDEILKKVRASLLQVKNGTAVYERDSVLFDEIQYSWPLLAGLLYAAGRSQGRINVLDFGGSLGSTYYQNKKFLDGLSEVSWSIVEQKQFVDVGQKDLEDHRLKFYYDVESCKEKNNPNVLVLSSVLQYIEDWEGMIQFLLKFNIDILIIDLTPFSISGKERITVQKVQPSIYNAAYPCWIFNEIKFCNIIETKYNLIEAFQTMESLRIHLSENDEAVYKGFIYQRK